MLYFLASVTNFVMSGGTGGELRSSANSRTKCSKPAGAHRISILAGVVPAALKP